MKKTYHGITVNDLYNPLCVQFNMLVDDILEYESDTFSSSGNDLTPQEAEAIALAFILEDIEGRRHHNTMDGSMISEKLDDIRNAHEGKMCAYAKTTEPHNAETINDYGKPVCFKCA